MSDVGESRATSSSHGRTSSPLPDRLWGSVWAPFSILLGVGVVVSILLSNAISDSRDGLQAQVSHINDDLSRLRAKHHALAVSVAVMADRRSRARELDPGGP